MDKNEFEKDSNTVVIRGRVVNVFYTDYGKSGNAILTVDAGSKNYPKVFVTKDVLSDIADQICEGALISICGNIQHSNRENGTTTFSVWGDKVELMENDSRNCTFFISGHVKSVQCKGKDTIVAYIETFGNGRKAIVPITIFEPIFNIGYDDYLKCFGTVDTWKRQKEKGKPKYYESYVADIYAKV